ncbi:hypothetical protein [Mahella australiensis]|nr:hypothetical protein [Mahella australiensis]
MKDNMNYNINGKNLNITITSITAQSESSGFGGKSLGSTILFADITNTSNKIIIIPLGYAVPDHDELNSNDERNIYDKKSYIADKQGNKYYSVGLQGDPILGKVAKLEPKSGSDINMAYIYLPPGKTLHNGLMYSPIKPLPRTGDIIKWHITVYDESLANELEVIDKDITLP